MMLLSGELSRKGESGADATGGQGRASATWRSTSTRWHAQNEK
jgi:hypothetical protein